jgi:Flp pilus assembly protein TadG
MMSIQIRQHIVHRLRDSQGNTILETALVIPVLVLMLIVVVDMGRAFTMAIANKSAAHAGAIYGSLHPSDTAGMIAAAKLDAADWAVVIPIATFGCQCSDGTSAVASCTAVPTCSYNSVYYVQVSTTAVYVPLLPYTGFTSSLTLKSTARLRASR